MVKANSALKSRSKYLLVLLFFFLINSLQAQVKITGNIHSKSEKPLEGANIIILDGGTTIDYTLSNKDGFFSLSLNEGVYTIRIAYWCNDFEIPRQPNICRNFHVME